MLHFVIVHNPKDPMVVVSSPTALSTASHISIQLGWLRVLVVATKIVSTMLSISALIVILLGY